MKKVLRISSLVLVAIMCVAMLASCGVGAKKYEQNLKDAGYTITYVSDEKIEEANETAEGEYTIKAQYTATKGLNSVTITQYANSKQAEAQKDKLLEGGASLFGALSVEVDGSCVLYGTEDAVNIALGE